MMSETMVEMMPTMSEMRPPWRTRASMSRPALSVPIGCVQEKSPSAEVKGGNDCSAPPRCWRGGRPPSVGTFGVLSSLISSVPYARVDEGVGHVHQQVEG